MRPLRSLSLLVASGLALSSSVAAHPEPAPATARNAQRLLAPAAAAPVIDADEFARIREARASGTVPEAQLLPVKSKGVGIAFDYNNFGNRLLARDSVGLTLSVDGALKINDELVLRGVDGFGSGNVGFASVQYSIPVNARGTRLAFSASGADTRVGAELEILDIRGDTQTLDAGVIHPVTRRARHAENLSAFISASQVRNKIFRDTLVSEDEIRTLAITHDGSHSRPKSTWVHSVSLLQGLGDAFDGRDNADPLLSRVGARTTFTNVVGAGAASFELSEAGQAVLTLNAQLASGPMTVRQQFPLGGPGSVRGFILGEFLGDSGFATTGEYRHRLWRSSARDHLLQGAVFLDHGYAELKLPQFGERPERSLTGAGFGVLASSKHLSFRADVGFPLNTRNNIEGDSSHLYAQAITRW